jgi:hypothetical protein
MARLRLRSESTASTFAGVLGGRVAGQVGTICAWPPGFVSGLRACNTTDAGEYPRALAANSDDEARSIAQSLIELRHPPPALSFGEAFAT